MLRPSVRVADTRTARPAPKVADGFYLTPAWRAAREEAVALGLNRCAKCGRTGCRLFVDHIVELQDGGAPFDQSNLEAICGSCHSAKTAAERAKRMAR